MTDQVAIQKVSNYFDNEIVRARFAEVVGTREAGAYISSVLIAVAESDALQQCSLPSIYSAALRAATLRLTVEPSIGQAYLVPFKGKATLIVGYKGLHDMAVRTGKYRYINVGPVYEGEEAVEDRISGFHRLEGSKTSNKVIGYLAAFEMRDGYGHTLYMTKDEIHEHAQKYSKSYDNPKSGWKTDTAKMERKTVLRLLLRRWGYLDPSDAAALDAAESDNDFIEGEIIEEQPEQPPEDKPRRTEEQLLHEMGF